MDLLSETFLRIRDLQQKCNTNIRKYKPPLDGKNVFFKLINYCFVLEETK